MLTLYKLPVRCTGRGPRLVTDPLGPEDTLRIIEHFRALSPADRALRFRCSATTDAWIGRTVSQIDFAHETLLGIVAPNRTLAGLLQMRRFRNGRRACAELSFSVHPAWRGCGLAHRLMRLALEHARLCGIGAIVASVAPGHHAMRAVLAASGMRFVIDDDEWFGTLEVADEAAYGAPAAVRHSPPCSISSLSSRRFRPTPAT